MAVLYVLLGVLGLLLLALLLLLFLPVYVRVGYDQELTVRVRVLGIPFTLLPAPPREESPKKEKTAAPKGKPSKAKELKKELTDSFRRDGVGATLHYLQQLAVVAGKAAGRMLRAVTVDTLHLELCIATGDPSDTAVRYGQVCGVLYPALSAVEQVVTVRRRQLRVEPNFLLDTGGVYADVRLHVWVFRVVGAALWLLCRYLMMSTQTSVDQKEVTTHGK